MLRQTLAPTLGEVKIPSDSILSYVPQIIEEFDDLSGGQCSNGSLTKTLKRNPDILLLEPTNHLDLKNRELLIHSFKSFLGTLIMEKLMYFQEIIMII